MLTSRLSIDVAVKLEIHSPDSDILVCRNVKLTNEPVRVSGVENEFHCASLCIAHIAVVALSSLLFLQFIA